MISKHILLIIFLITRTILFAQNQEEIIKTRPLNNINLNLLGDASLISVNYERLFLVSPIFLLSSKSGLGYNIEFLVYGDKPEQYLTMPLHITGNLGKGMHFIEFGLGATAIIGVISETLFFYSIGPFHKLGLGNSAFSEPNTQPYILYPIIGYRIIPLRSLGINFRGFLQIPFTGFDAVNILFIPFGVNFGVSF